jgi:parvulin-like peptidyl-prolyl isomerase
MTPTLPFVVTAASLALFWPAASLAEGGRRIVNQIVAIVDQAVITKRDVEQRLAVAARSVLMAPPGNAAASRERDSRLATLRAAVLDELIAAELIAAEAGRRGVSVEPEDVDRTLAEVAQGNGLKTTQVLAAVAEQGMNEVMYRAELKREILASLVTLRWLGDETMGDASAPVTARELDAARERMVTTLRERAFVKVRE